MDPLSITGACVGLVASITTLSLKINSFVREVRDARSDMEAVKTELGSLEMVLGILEEESKGFEGPGFRPALVKQVCGILANCGSVLQDIEKALAQFSKGQARNGLKWAVSGRGDIEKMRSYLEVHKSALNIALDMIELLGDYSVWR